MDDAGNRSASAVVDIRHGTGNRTGNGNTAENRYDDIGGPLCNQFGIGVMLVSCHTVGHRSGQQRFDCS